MSEGKSETGAVFTLGRSYLSENHQSYFYIKNDPIKKVVAGDNQSAVICESGRLFVWGENQYGQLSVGSKEVVTKPSCVKEIKNLGYKVRNIAFGEAFSVILTENNKVFFNGKSIFTLGETYGGNRIRSLDNGSHCVNKHNYEIIDFQRRCLDDQGNLDDLVDIVAGQTHFVVLTNSGKLYCYGFFDASKIKRQKHFLEPKRISEHLVARIAKCGSTFAVFVTDCNGIYLIGKLNGIEYNRITKLNTSELKDTIYSIYVSRKNEIFLISSGGNVYKSSNETEIRFERIILFNQNDNIRKFCAGSDFVCVLTDKNKFLTTFNEKVSAKNKNPTVRPPHELRKFQDLKILDIATGLHHILLFAVSKSNSPSFDITSSDANENISIKTIPEPLDQPNLIEPIEVKSTVTSLSEREPSPPPTTNEIGQKSVLAKETLEIIQSDIAQSEQTEDNNEAFEEKIDEISNEIVKEAFQLQTQEQPPLVEQSTSSIEQAPTMDKLKSGVSNIGDSLMADIQSIATAGEEKLNDLAKVTEKSVKEVQEVPKNVIDYVKTSVTTKLDDLLETDTKKAKDDVLQANIDEEKGNNLPKQMTEQKLSNDNSLQQPDDISDSDKMKHQNKLSRAMAEDDSNETIVDDMKDTMAHSEVKFIDNGVDVSSSTNIIQAMKDEMNEMSNEVKNKADELTMKYDGIVNAELGAAKENISTKLNQVKSAEKDILKEMTESPIGMMTKIIPLKADMDEVDLEGDGDTEQTTASIKSVSTPAKQTELDENMETMESMKDPAPKEHSEGGRVRRFFNEIKNNCKTADTVLEMEQSAMQQIKSHSLNDVIGDNKTSKVCTIL